MARIVYLIGDATEPVGEDCRVITHICNDEGKWGSGFVLAISKKWPNPEVTYRSDIRLGAALGGVSIVPCGANIFVANIIGQKGIRYPGRKDAPIRYEAVEEGLIGVEKFATKSGGEVHMPRMGCDRAGGTWEKMEPIIQRTLVDKGVNVFVYDYGVN